VIRDYLNGKLTYFTTPPQVDGDDSDENDEENGEGSDEQMEDDDQ
jgi:hypothetical protein